jgi:conjugative relaxase-like TrwC/TraI family protein
VRRHCIGALPWCDPLTGRELAAPVSRARVPGFDLMFSAPKSASVLFGIGEANVRATIRRAQVEAVDQALGYLEDVACRGRFGAGGQGGGFAGRGFLAAAFEHRTSRAGDPQLHTHVLVANTIQRPDGQWATLDGRLIYAHAKTAGYIHEAAFRRALARDLGLEWGRVVNGIADIRGVPEPVLEAFSRRSREIDAYVRRRGEHSAAARQVAAVRTREAKDYAVTPAQSVPEWRERAAALGLDEERVPSWSSPAGRRWSGSSAARRSRRCWRVGRD